MKKIFAWKIFLPVFQIVQLLFGTSDLLLSNVGYTLPNNSLIVIKC